MTSSVTPTDGGAHADGTDPAPDAAASGPEPEAKADDVDDSEDDSDDESEDDTAAVTAADAVPTDTEKPPAFPWWYRNLPRLTALTASLVGWSFIGWHEHFRITPPAVFLCLGWLAVVEAVLFLWRTGFSAADDDPENVAWWKPVGEADELVREKRALLKAIKEIEFDREMGKMNDADAGEIVGMYRARAIEVIKALDALEKGGAGTVTDEIQREVRARMELVGAKARAKAKRGAKAARR